MNLDPHWLKERYKDYTSEQLQVVLIFSEWDAQRSEIEIELERRERETP